MEDLHLSYLFEEGFVGEATHKVIFVWRGFFIRASSSKGASFQWD
jgi:hypothetical protein